MKLFNVAMFACIIIMSASFPSVTNAADKYRIGFNETWIVGYLNHLRKYCTDPNSSECPHNFVSADYNSISSLILDLAANQHVGTFREIIPLNAIKPSQSTNNYDDIIQLLTIYQGYNVNLILSVGSPIAPDMTVTGNTYYIMPSDYNTWVNFRYPLANTLAGLLNAMWNSSSINRQWMSTHLFVESYNEFDGMGTPQSDGSVTNIFSDPGRAAELSLTLNYYISIYGISVQQLTPSFVGVYPNIYIWDYLHQFYANGGAGIANVHLYSGSKSSSGILSDIKNDLYNIVQATPSLQGQIFISETGNANATPPYCPSTNASAIDPVERQNEYAAIAADPTINQFVQTITFWRLMQEAPSLGCEAYYGVVNTYPPGGYNATGQNLFNYLKQ